MQEVSLFGGLPYLIWCLNTEPSNFVVLNFYQSEIVEQGSIKQNNK